MTTPLRRLLLLAALLPQLLVLGLGRGVVLCVEPDGHVQIELATAEICCAGAPALNAANGIDRESEGDDCNACTDLRLVVDTRGSRSSDGLDAAAHAATLAAADPWKPAVRASRTLVRAGAPPDRAPRHLLCLRSVLQRC